MNNLPMMNEIMRQATLARTIRSVEQALLSCCDNIKKQNKHKRIIITGSGDSYYIGLAAKPYFEKLCKDSVVEVLSSMDFAKYGVLKADSNTTVIAISISGNVMRTIECVQKAQQGGAFVIGITNNAESSLYGAAERPVYLDLDTEPTWTCGTLTYTASLYALLRTAIVLSDDEAEGDSQLCDINDIMGKIGEVIEKSREICKNAARNMRIIGNTAPVFVLGAGPNYATAKYGAAKFMEICSTLGVGQECEEFCHAEFWVVDRANPIFLIAPCGDGFVRCGEVYNLLRTFGCDLFVLSDNEELCRQAKFSVLMPKCNELLTPLLYSIPFQLVSYYYSYELGLNPDTRDHTDPFRKQCSRLLTRGKVTEL